VKASSWSRRWLLALAVSVAAVGGSPVVASATAEPGGTPSLSVEEIPAPLARPEPAPAPLPEPIEERVGADERRAERRAHTRRPDFVVPGAPREPSDEMPLPARARLLADRMDRAPRPTRALIHHWLYQHAWIVTGAEFGWSDGADALRILIALDRRLEARWGLGARSEARARRALATVESKGR
jgi:hypothetical protein